MQQNNQDKIEQARHLYFSQAKTQKEIAQILNICEKTIYNWIKRFSWDQLRQAARQAPALISENLASHIVEMQNSISRRQPGERYPTAEESLVMQRLITMMEKMKKFPGLAMNAQVLETFRNWMRPRDKSFTRDLSLYAGLFLQGNAQNNYYPYQLEFGIENISPFDPFYKEEPTEETKTNNCHPEPAEGMPNAPEPAEGLPNDPEPAEMLPHDPEPVEGLPHDPTPAEGLANALNFDLGHPDLAQRGLSSGVSSRACRGTVNSLSKSAQVVDGQRTYGSDVPLPPPVKTSKDPVINGALPADPDPQNE